MPAAPGHKGFVFGVELLAEAERYAGNHGTSMHFFEQRRKIDDQTSCKSHPSHAEPRQHISSVVPLLQSRA